jgi:hypothetical protein
VIRGLRDFCAAWFLLDRRGDICGENWVKVRKYEGKTENMSASDELGTGEKLFFSEASFGVAGVILILALCDLGILFTSY